MNFKQYGEVLVSVPVNASGSKSSTFVAEPNGVDDHANIQEALDIGAGGVVYLAKGVYKTSKTIYVPENTTLCGMGSGTVIKLTSSAGLSVLPWRIVVSNTTCKPVIANARPQLGEKPTEGVVVKNLVVDGEDVIESSTTHTLIGVLLADAENCHIKDVDVYYINWSLEHNVGRKGYNIGTTRANNCSVIGGNLWYGGYECLGAFDFSTNIRFQGIYVGTGMRCSAQVHQASSNIHISGCTFELASGGNYTNGNLLVHGRVASDYGVDDHDLICRNIIITDNIFMSSNEYSFGSGIGLIEAMENLIVTNNVLNVNSNGMNLVGYLKDALVSNNRVVSLKRGMVTGKTSLSSDRKVTGVVNFSNNSIECGQAGLIIDSDDGSFSVIGNSIKSDEFSVLANGTQENAAFVGNFFSTKFNSVTTIDTEADWIEWIGNRLQTNRS